MNSVETVLARRYADAYGAVYGDRWSHGAYERLQELILSLEGVYGNVRSYLNTSCVSPMLFCPALMRYMAQYHLENLLEPLVILLARQRRLVLCKVVLQAWSRWYERKHAIQRITIHTAVPLEQEQYVVLISLLKRVTHSEQVYTTTVHDPDIGAGVALVGRDFIWEDSIRQRLRVLVQVCQR